MRSNYRFYVEVRLARIDACKRWIRSEWYSSMRPSLQFADAQSSAKDGNGDYVFQSVRIRYRGMTLHQVSQ